MSIAAKADLPRFRVFKRSNVGLDSRSEGWDSSSLGSISSIVCSPSVRSSPSFSINLACRVKLSSISSAVEARGFRAGRFPVKPKRYLERRGRLDELIRVHNPLASRVGYVRGSTVRGLNEDKVRASQHDSQHELLASPNWPEIRKTGRD